MEAAYRDFSNNPINRKQISEGRAPGDPCDPFQPAQVTAPGLSKVAEGATTKGNGRLLCMPILLPGGPYAEAGEVRMRTRYAVLAALGRCNYKLALATRMSYIRVRVHTEFNVLDKKIRDPIIVPVKLYQPDLIDHSQDSTPAIGKRYGGVLLCWLDEEQLGDRPIDAIRQILKRIFPGPDRRRAIDVAIVGPSGSDMLVRMKKDRDATAKQLDALDFRQLLWYSPRATLYDGILANEKDDKNPNENSPVLIRTIPTDEVLVEAICQELEYRKALPEKPGNERERQDTEEKRNKYHIVLITERDTIYGRAFEQMFRRRVDKDHRIPAENVLVYTYLRGLDGVVPGDTESKEKSNEDRTTTDGVERPEGRAQLDYLRRLECQLTRCDAQLRQDGGRITAVGVVGTDFYDKLLVLRAIRTRLPNVWFFTTDLDAGFTHPAEYEYTRNLLVATHFGLRLNQRIQKDVGPFRDSYQTSNFLATLMALSDKPRHISLSKDEEVDLSGIQDLHPLIYEIGRSKPYQLTTTAEFSGNAAQEVHPKSPREFIPLNVPWLVVGTALILLAASYYLRSVRYAVVTPCLGLYDILLLPLLGIAALVRSLARKSSSQRARQQRSRRTGPPAGGENALDRVCGRLLDHARTRVSPNSVFEIVVLVFLILGVWGAISVWSNHRQIDGEPFVWLEGISVWPSVLLRFIAGVASVVFLYVGLRGLHRNHDLLAKNYLGVKAPLMPHPWYLPKWARRAMRNEPQAKVTLFRSIFILGWPDRDGLSVKQLYIQYQDLGLWWRRLLRVLIVSTVFFFFGLALLQYSGLPNIPARGQFAHAATKGVTLAAVFLMTLAIFFVLDATLLCRNFVSALPRAIGSWPKRAIRRHKKSWNAIGNEALAQRLAIRLIADRTHVLNRLLWWPWVLIVLMVVSRVPAIDNWDVPWPLILIVALNLSGPMFCGLILRIDCRKLRRSVLDRARDELAQAVGAGDAAKAEQLKLLIQDAETARRGAFSSPAEDPLLLSLLVPFGGVGGLFFLEQLTKWL